MPTSATPLLTRTFDHTEVTELRHAVASCLGAAGLHGESVDDFVLAINELITNAVRHGGGQGTLRLWCNGPAILCEISDHGGGISGERLRLRERPAPDTAGGWGLWLTRQLSDDMTVQTGPAGTTVRISAVVGSGTPPRAPDPADPPAPNRTAR